jgi:hypothetical protein
MALKHAARDVFAFLGTSAGTAAVGAGIFLTFNQPCPGLELLTCVGGVPAEDFATNFGYFSVILGFVAALISENLGADEG